MHRTTLGHALLLFVTLSRTFGAAVLIVTQAVLWGSMFSSAWFFAARRSVEVPLDMWREAFLPAIPVFLQLFGAFALAAFGVVAAVLHALGRPYGWRMVALWLDVTFTIGLVHFAFTEAAVLEGPLLGTFEGRVAGWALEQIPLALLGLGVYLTYPTKIAGVPTPPDESVGAASATS